MMTVFLDGKWIKGLVDTATDTIILFNDAKAFSHWKLRDVRTITGVSGNSTNKATVSPVHRKDLDGNQGRSYPIVSDAIPALFGDGVFWKKWCFPYYW